MPTTFTTMTPGDPASEAYSRLMHGAALADADRLAREDEQRRQEKFSPVWERLLHNAGVTAWLAPGQDLSWSGGTPRRSVRARGGRTSDLVRLIPWVLREKVAGDVVYEDAARHEDQVTRGHGLEPGDAASIRFRSTNPATTDGQPLPPGGEREAERFLELQAILAVYTAAPYFMPACEAFDAVTGLPPEPGASLRLTAEAVLVFHDGVPLPAVIADDEALHAHAAGRFGAGHDTLFEGHPLIMGGVLLAHPDDDTGTALLLNPALGWLIIANRMHDGRYAWAMHAVHRLDTNPGPAARVLRNYAALNALENWDTPPPVPGRARTSGKSRKTKSQAPAAQRRQQQLEQAARTPQARAGALLGVRVLSFTAPPHQAATPPLRDGNAGRAPAQYRDWRRAHWTRNTRVHLLDEQGRPSGPVYGPDAVEGVTFTRRRTRVKGAWINEHLPRGPAERRCTRWTRS
ncbi:hypothetical protein [Streptomyces yaizuensis]|uniref:PE-PGRS family protein n=1 Tax=Streptomyces yaizuensis TaxID=2989713 RepID=A0ABQ5P642_9ACTN|nr:hypothetical protein [Streptomyces sp. YSPA8]GLF98035.1 hypothetical protein SYYSPA8_27080 [Streptomyces sp. YSPA8]